MSTDTTVLTPPDAHLVHFYENDAELLDRVVGFLCPAIAAGDVAIVIATPAHRASFAARLENAGLDVDAARAREQLVELDAADTLAQLTAAGAPDAARFERTIGSLVRAAAAPGRRVFAFGEMVALLWEAGSVAPALALEDLWNRLRDEVPFGLFCAYPSWLTETEGGVSGFADVCTAHSHVVAAAPPARTAEAVRRFPKSSAAPGAARRFVRDWLTERGYPHLVEVAQLAVSELATNAVLHAASDFTVSLDRSRDVVRIAVGDTSTDAPVRGRAEATARRGRGLAIVESLTSACGHELLDGGKLVWADLPIFLAPQAPLS